jgi:uncharacterized protein
MRPAYLAAAVFMALAVTSAQAQQTTDQAQAALKAYQARDYQTAARLWYELANAGDGVAQYNLGRLYAQGEGVRRDLSEAYKWFYLARIAGRGEGTAALNKIAPTMTPAQMAEGERRAAQWRQARRP